MLSLIFFSQVGVQVNGFTSFKYHRFIIKRDQLFRCDLHHGGPAAEAQGSSVPPDPGVGGGGAGRYPPLRPVPYPGLFSQPPYPAVSWSHPKGFPPASGHPIKWFFWGVFESG